MSIQVHNGLLRIAVGLQNITVTDMSHRFGRVLFGLLKHIVQGTLVVAAGATTYILLEPAVDPIVAAALALVIAVAATRFFYFSTATGVALTAAQTANQVRQQFDDEEFDWHDSNVGESSWYDYDRDSDTDIINSHEVTNFWHDPFKD